MKFYQREELQMRLETSFEVFVACFFNSLVFLEEDVT